MGLVHGFGSEAIEGVGHAGRGGADVDEQSVGMVVDMDHVGPGHPIEHCEQPPLRTYVEAQIQVAVDGGDQCRYRAIEVSIGEMQQDFLRESEGDHFDPPLFLQLREEGTPVVGRDPVITVQFAAEKPQVGTDESVTISQSRGDDGLGQYLCIGWLDGWVGHRSPSPASLDSATVVDSAYGAR